MILALSFTSILLIVGAYQYYILEKDRIRRDKINDLSAITNLKIKEIVQWHKERKSEAEYFSEGSTFINYTKELNININEIQAKKYFTKSLEHIKATHSYENIFISSRLGKILFSLENSFIRIDSVTKQYIQEAILQKKIFFRDIFYCPEHKRVHYDLVSPIIDENNNSVAVMIMRINPDDYLYSLIQSWPLPSETAEVLIFRKEKDHVLFLNDLRHKKNIVLSEKIPLIHKDEVSVIAVSGRQGIIEGKDYRNIDVIADVHPVPGTSWFLASKIDSGEVYSELGSKKILISLIVIISILFVGTGITLAYNYRKTNLYKEMFLKEKKLSETQEEYRTALYSIGDGVITTDINGCIKQMNFVAEQLTGWKEAEAKGRILNEVFHILNEETYTLIENPVQRVIKEGIVLGFANHTLLVSKTGKEIPITNSASSIKNKDNEIMGVVLVFNDQTEKRAAQKMLSESELRFSTIFHFSPVGIAISNIDDGKFVDANESFLKLCGFTKEEIIGLSSVEMGVNPEERNRFAEVLREKGKIQGVEREFRLKSGVKKNGLLSADLIELDGKKYVLSIIHDITDRKLTEEALQASENKFSTAFRISPDSININRLSDGVYIEVNEGFCSTTGYKPEEIIGRSSLDFNIWVEPKDRECLVQNLKQHGHVVNMEALFRMKNGEILTGLMSARTINLNGEECILSITRDISERKHAEEKIRKLSRGIEQSPAVIMITDINGNIEYTNPKFTEVTGFTFDEVKGKNPRILKSGDKPLEEYQGMWKTLLDKKEWRGEFQNKRKNGELYWELASISPIVNERGEITNFIAVKENITEWKKMTSELIIAKEKAEEMNRVKSYFYANISHELRTPFVGIIGFAELLAETLKKSEEKDMAEIILKSSRRLIDTLNKILNIAKLEFDKPEIHLSYIDLREIFKNLRILYSKSAEMQNTTIRTEFKCKYSLFRTDEILLHEILTNLISNAVKYTSNGLIEISAETIIKNKKEYLTIKVADNGIGIPKEKQEIIWHEFRQVSEGFSRSFEGTGLGLSIVKKYTELLGGEIFLESEAGNGSTFTVELPMMLLPNEISKTAVQENSVEKEILVENKATGKSILLVEDDPIAAEFVRRILSENYNLDFAKSADKALEKIGTNHYSALLIDINLGYGMDGVELMQLIRKKPEYITIPIVAVTAYATTTDQEEFLAKGFSHYISKPFASKDMISLLREVFKETS